MKTQNLSPGLKSDILHGKTNSIKLQPSASTHTFAVAQTYVNTRKQKNQQLILNSAKN